MGFLAALSFVTTLVVHSQISFGWQTGFGGEDGVWVDGLHSVRGPCPWPHNSNSFIRSFVV